MRSVKPGAEAFDLRAAAGPSPGRLGVLCVHGFTGSPFEMRWLGEQMAARGFDALGPALAGHEHGDPRELDRTTWHDWYASAEAGFDALRRRCERVAVVGLSMGGLLALRLARQRGAEMVAVASLAAPIWLPRHIEATIKVVNGAMDGLARVNALRELPPVPKLGGSDVFDREMRALNPTMPGMPVRALASLLELMRVVRRDLAGVKVPALVAHARRDHTAPFACAAKIQARLGSPEVRGMTLERSYHVITIDVEREQVARAVGDFFAEKGS